MLEPETPLIDNWHLSLMCEYLEAVHSGEIRRLLINCPPRYTKSRVVSVCFPCWEWVDSPWIKYMFSSYALELSRDHSRERRDILLSDWYQRHWGDKVQLRSDQNIITSFGNTRGGLMQSRGTEGVGLGKGANRVIVDDPHSIKEAESDSEREQAIIDFNTNLSTRLNDKKKDAIIVVMQRVHAKDVSSEAIRQGYEHIKIKASPPESTVYYRFPVSGRVYERPAGEVLCEAREGVEELEQQKVILGSYRFAALYDQEPAPEGGGRIKLEWFPRYKSIAHPERTVVSVDCANKAKELANFSVWEVFQRVGRVWHMVLSIKARVNYPELKARTISICQDFEPDELLIEDKGNGTALIPDLEGTSDFIWPVIAIEPHGEKPVRMDNQTAKCEAGLVALPDTDYIEAPWLHGFIQNLIHFPEPEEWDEIDAFSQFLNRCVSHRDLSGVALRAFGTLESANADW